MRKPGTPILEAASEEERDRSALLLAHALFGMVSTIKVSQGKIHYPLGANPVTLLREMRGDESV